MKIMKGRNFTINKVSIVVLIVFLLFLNACGGNVSIDSNVSTTANATTAATQAAAAAETTTESTTMAATAATAAQQTDNIPKTQLTVEVFDRANENGTDPTNNYWTDWIKEQCLNKFNMEVNFVSVPRSDEVPQLTVLMAGGTPPDILFTYNISLIFNFYSQGGVTDLTDLITQYGPTINHYLGDDILSQVQFDGRQYIIPAKKPIRGVYNTFIRKDWLDKLNLPMPQNMDDFYNALVSFKELNPGGVDKVIPYGMDANTLAYAAGNILDSYTEYATMTDEEKFVLNVKQTLNSSNMLFPGFKEGVRYLNKLFNEGLIDPEFALYSYESEVEDLFARGVVGAFCQDYDDVIRTNPGIYNILKQNVPDAEVQPLDCFINVADGSHQRQVGSGLGIFTFVPASTKNADGAVKYLDWLCGDDVRIYITTGEEGINHTKNADGIPEMINLQNHPYMFNSPNNLDYAIIVNGVDLGDMDKNLLAQSLSYEPQYKDWYLNAYEVGMHDGVRFDVLAVPFESEGKYINSLNEKRIELMTVAISAKPEDFDRVYDSGIQEWLAIGGQECIDERQAYWDENYK